ncbi:MAG TPA: mechanosensitive ion channel family protein [Gemmatimonadaceae bacterium]|nr:mechanosensitive ion channel family protein [Gemmatimonadaceae bacterium]
MNSSEAWNTVHTMVRDFYASLPRLIFAFIVVIFFYILSRIVKAIVRRTTDVDSSRRTLRIAMGRIVQGVIIVIGALVAVTAAFPGFTPANLISALGIGGIAIGFAFKDIFENFLAGILILVTRPFRIGDQIIYDRYEGTVEDIQTRATWLKTYDGRRVVIPNSELFKNSVTVNTAFDTRRLEYDFKLAAGEDVEKAKAVIIRVMRESKDVLPDPKADAVVIGFDQGSVTLRARWWSRSRIADVLLGQDHVLATARAQLAAAGIKLPSGPSPVVINALTGATPAQSTAVDSAPAPVLAKDQPDSSSG